MTISKAQQLDPRLKDCNSVDLQEAIADLMALIGIVDALPVIRRSTTFGDGPLMGSEADAIIPDACPIDQDHLHP